MIKIFKEFILRLTKSIPELDIKLKQASMLETPEEFVKKTLVASFYMATGFLMVFGALFLKSNFFVKMLIVFFPFLFIGMFFYFIKLPDVRIIKKRKQIDKEIVFAGRFLIVELSSGVLLYEAIANVTISYKEIGKTFSDILHKIDLGTSVEDALNDAIKYTPSNDFRRLMWQIINALRTGADVSDSLKSVVDQITREQTIEIKKYAKKLNPLAMFYMIIAVILPSLGVTMLIVLSSFISIELGLSALLAIVVLFGLMQFMFFTVIKSSRPSIGV